MQQDHFDIIVFSHLRWDFVWQRPQHIISRLAQDRKILFVEEPKGYNQNKIEVKTYSPTPNITVLQPYIGSIKNELSPLVNDAVSQLQIQNPVLWFYSPQFQHVLPHIDHKLSVYDCMDQLSAFKNAPQPILENENILLNTVDIVFTGGKSLYEDKKQKHAHVFCFPSSVDKEHFQKARAAETQIPDDAKNIKHPTVGFYGVIDERINLDVIDKVTHALPQVNFLFIGPMAKINKENLPSHPNTYYLGQKEYTQLPDYLKAIDIAWMPFAHNEATRFISPTKTLEFMAAHKPIISTAIYDVVRDYSEVVSIRDTAEQTINSIQNYLNESQKEKSERIAKYETILNQTSWDNTVEQMTAIIQKQLQKEKHDSVNQSETASKGIYL